MFSTFVKKYLQLERKFFYKKKDKSITNLLKGLDNKFENI